MVPQKRQTKTGLSDFMISDGSRFLNKSWHSTQQIEVFPLDSAGNRRMHSLRNEIHVQMKQVYDCAGDS